MSATPTRAAIYDARTIALHWVMFALVLALWILGQFLDNFAKGAPRTNARSVHISMGLILACLLVLRIAWRLTGGIRLPQSDPGVSGKMAIGAHLLLYALLLVVVLLGLACVWTRGDTLLHQFAVPVFDPGNRRLAESTVGLHGLAANLLGIVAASHASTAVLHHWLLKDGVLRRMWPGRRRDRS